VYLGTPPVGAIRRQIYSLIADCSLSTASLKAELHGLRLVRGTGPTIRVATLHCDFFRMRDYRSPTGCCWPLMHSSFRSL
jgi:hypothetical protein